MDQEPIHRNPLRGAPLWVHGFTWGLFGAFTLLLLARYYFYRDTDVWFLWFENSPGPRGTFAETIRPSIFRTPANTWSNLGYILVGMYVVAYAWWDARRETTEQDPYAVRQPALMGLYGVASEYAFSEFTFDTDPDDPTVTFRLISQSGDIKYRLQLKRSQLTPANH